jgi:hemin uptake protein HemP
MTSDEALPPDSPTEQTGKIPHPPRRMRSEEILHGELEVLIDHQGETYRLRQTRNGKLILQK